MEDFDIPQNKLAESAERVVDRALLAIVRRELQQGLILNLQEEKMIVIFRAK